MGQLANISMQFQELASFNRLGGINTFFGRMELFESEMGRRHLEAGNDWRKPGRYGNVVSYKPTLATIDFCLEQGWEPEWFFELSKLFGFIYVNSYSFKK